MGGSCISCDFLLRLLIPNSVALKFIRLIPQLSENKNQKKKPASALLYPLESLYVMTFEIFFLPAAAATAFLIGLKLQAPP